MACHLRSTSLPSRPHSDEAAVEEELQSLNAATPMPFATIETACDGLRRLGEAYSCIQEILRLPSNQKKMVEQELERSLTLLDLCNAMQESLAELRTNVQELHCVVRRGDDAAAQIKIQSYIRAAKKAQKQFSKICKKTSSDKEVCKPVRPLVEAREVAVSLLQSTLQLLSNQIAMPGAGKWSLVSKPLQKRRVVCEEEQLQALERGIGDLEIGVAVLFRRLIQSRVTLLNILSS